MSVIFPLNLIFTICRALDGDLSLRQYFTEYTSSNFEKPQSTTTPPPPPKKKKNFPTCSTSLPLFPVAVLYF